MSKEWGVDWDRVVDEARERLNQETSQEVTHFLNCGCPNCLKQASSNQEILAREIEFNIKYRGGVGNSFIPDRTRVFLLKDENR